jgi:hypothetical protein
MVEDKKMAPAINLRGHFRINSAKAPKYKT